jgi:hypothetical protein
MIKYVKIPVAGGKIALVDAKDAPAVTPHSWSLSNGYPSARIQGKLVTLHILLLGKPPSGYVTDHINKNKLDNRRENLRFTTREVNFRNSNFWEKGGRKPGKHSPGGVGIDRTHGKYKAYYTAKGERVNVGTFCTREEAEIARIQAYTAYVESL